MDVLGMKDRDLLELNSLLPDQILKIINKGIELKQQQKSGISHKLLEGKTLALLFQKPSTRTRLSFEVGMKQLGGFTVYLSWNDMQLGRGETISDTAKVMSRYVDIIMARLFAHNDIVELADNATVPIINGLTDMYHPCQILADLMTIYEKKEKLRGLKLSYVGDGNNVCHSLLIGCSKVGMDIFVGTPKQFQPDPTVVALARENAQQQKSIVEILNDPSEAVTSADVIYTDTFVSMGQEKEKESRLVQLKDYQVNRDLVDKAKSDYLFMHCLPSHRGEEVTSEIIDDPEHSIVWDEAENRMHVQKAVLALILRG